MLHAGDGGGGHWLVQMEWHPAGLSVYLPLLIFPCTIKSRSSLLAPAHARGPRKKAVKRLWLWSEMCCMWLAGNIGRKNDAKIRHLGTIVQLCWAEFSQLRHVSTIEKNLLNNNISSICPHNMANFSPLAAEIGSGVWGTPTNFNGFHFLAALVHATLVLGVSQTLWH